MSADLLKPSPASGEEPGENSDEDLPEERPSEEMFGSGMNRFERLRVLEAEVFASSEPVPLKHLLRHAENRAELEALLGELETFYAGRGINLVRVGEAVAFRTASDVAAHLTIEQAEIRRLTRAQLETLAIVAYHQPMTRAEIEEIRGTSLSRGTLDILLEAGWIRPRGRRRTPGRPVTWATTDAFLDHFGLESLEALPGREELRAAGLVDTRPAALVVGDASFLPAAESDDDEAPDEDPLAPEELEASLELAFDAEDEPSPPEDSAASHGDEEPPPRDAAEEGEAGPEPGRESDKPSEDAAR